MFLFVAVTLEPLHKFFKVNLMSVKFRSVHTGELGFVADGDAAGSTHAHAIYHYGVEAGYGFDVVGAGDVCDYTHHDWRTNSENYVEIVVLRD